jgi:hypothetical protein
LGKRLSSVLENLIYPIPVERNRQMQYYVGAIREVSIIRRSLAAEEIARRQQALAMP